jgi:hypothetical protein
MALEPKMMQILNLLLLYLILSKIYTYLIILLIKVNQLMIRDLNVQGRSDPWGGLHWFWCLNKNLNPLYCCIWHTKNCQKRNRIEKVMTPHSRGGQKPRKNKPPNATKANSQTPKNIVVCCYYNSKMICRTSHSTLVAL